MTVDKKHMDLHKKEKMKQALLDKLRAISTMRITLQRKPNLVKSQELDEWEGRVIAEIEEIDDDNNTI